MTEGLIKQFPSHLVHFTIISPYRKGKYPAPFPKQDIFFCGVYKRIIQQRSTPHCRKSAVKKGEYVIAEKGFSSSACLHNTPERLNEY